MEPCVEYYEGVGIKISHSWALKEPWAGKLSFFSRAPWPVTLSARYLFVYSPLPHHLFSMCYMFTIPIDFLFVLEREKGILS